MLTPGFVPVTIRNQNCLTYWKFALQKSELLTYLVCLPTKLLSLQKSKLPYLQVPYLKEKLYIPRVLTLP